MEFNATNEDNVAAMTLCQLYMGAELCDASTNYPWGQTASSEHSEDQEGYCLVELDTNNRSITPSVTYDRDDITSDITTESFPEYLTSPTILTDEIPFLDNKNINLAGTAYDTKSDSTCITSACNQSTNSAVFNTILQSDQPLEQVIDPHYIQASGEVGLRKDQSSDPMVSLQNIQSSGSIGLHCYQPSSTMFSLQNIQPSGEIALQSDLNQPSDTMVGLENNRHSGNIGLLNEQPSSTNFSPENTWPSIELNCQSNQLSGTMIGLHSNETNLLCHQHSETIVGEQSFMPSGSMISLQNTKPSSEIGFQSEQPSDTSIHSEDMNTKHENVPDLMQAVSKHHSGKINIDYKTVKREREQSLCKRRRTLLKKAFELHSITDSDVFCLVQDKNGQRWYYGSGTLKKNFCKDGIKSLDMDQEFLVTKDKDSKIIVEPSPLKPNLSQTYLPASLRSVKPNLHSSEKKSVALSSPKPRKGKKLFTDQTPQLKSKPKGNKLKTNTAATMASSCATSHCISNKDRCIRKSTRILKQSARKSKK